MIALLFLIVSIICGVCQANLLTNGDFETGSISPWMKGNPNDPNMNIAHGGTCYQGSYCLSMGTVRSDDSIQQSVVVQENSLYSLSFYLYSDGGLPNDFIAAAQFDGGPSISLESFTNLGQGFYNFLNTIPAPVGPIGQTISLTITFSARDDPGYMYLDLIDLEQGGSQGVGDPVFTGFHGQVFQVHGIPNRIFNIITTNHTQFNAKFKFIDENDEPMTGKEMLKFRSTQNYTIPRTAAWSHPGTYLGSISLQFKSPDTDQIDRLYIEPGCYEEGLSKIFVNDKAIDMKANRLSYPLDLFRNNGISVVLMSSHVVTISTPDVKFRLVNSDGFLNIESAALTDLTRNDSSIIDGILGQTADTTRFFPHYKPTQQVSSLKKDDWQQHQVMDYLVADNDFWSTDFPLNKF